MNRITSLEEKIKKVLSYALHFEMGDPNLDGVTFTRVKLSPDYGYLDVRFANYDEDERDVKLRSLQRAKGAFKKILSRKLSLRKIPEIRFHLDTDLFAEQRVNELLEQLNRQKAEENPDA